MILDAIKATVTTVTQTIKITTLPSGAASDTISVGVCGISNSTFSADGYTHTYTGVTASCSITLTTSGTSGSTRYEFDASPHPTASHTVIFTTASSGTGSYSNNSYYQLQSTYKATPLTPSTWDAIYSWSISGTFLGTSASTTSCTNTANGGGAVSCANCRRSACR